MPGKNGGAAAAAGRCRRPGARGRSAAHARRVDDVGGEEQPASAPAIWSIASSAASPSSPSAVRIRWAIEVEPVAAHLHRDQERALGGLHLVGPSKCASPAGTAGRPGPCSRRSASAGRPASGLRISVEERAADLLVGVARRARRPRGCSRAARSSSRVRAAADQQPEEDAEEHHAADGDQPADEQGLPIRRCDTRSRRRCGRRRASGPDPGAWLVVLFEEGQERDLLVPARARRASAGIEGKDMRQCGGILSPPRLNPSVQPQGAVSRASKALHVQATEELPATVDPGLAWAATGSARGLAPAASARSTRRATSASAAPSRSR